MISEDKKKGQFGRLTEESMANVSGSKDTKILPYLNAINQRVINKLAPYTVVCNLLIWTGDCQKGGR